MFHSSFWANESNGARCHHHPFEKWSQDDYYSLAAFFSRIGRKDLPGGNAAAGDRRIFHNESAGPPSAKNERTGKMLAPAGLGAPALQLTAQDDPRTFMVEWMSRPDNPYFAKALVNRYWKHFLARGIVEPEDDMRETNPPTNPELLNRLSAQFIASGYDLKELIRTICRSSTYQLSAIPNNYNVRDRQNYSRYQPKRLSAESLFDGFHIVAGIPPNISGQPAGQRSMQCADVSAAQNVYFLKVFGQPQADTACECERSQEANLAQSLHLLNGADIQNRIAQAGGRAERYAAKKDVPLEENIRDLYRTVYSREPDAEELQIATQYLSKNPEQLKGAYEDLIWTLINTKEFLFNH